MRTQSLAVFAGLIGLTGCSTTTHTTGVTASETTVIPTRFEGSRIYGRPVLPRGDTVSVFLDTGGGTLVWSAFTSWLGVTIDSIAGNNGNRIAVASFPQFATGATLPPVITKTQWGTSLAIGSPAPRGFAAWISRTTQMQLGANWFGDRIWTIDYPRKHLLLHSRTQPVTAPPEHRATLYFRTDTSGHRVAHSPHTDVIVDGDTLQFLIDTGGTIWLSADALAQVKDGGPSERAASHVQSWIFTRWRQRHPDWPVIEHADLWDDMTIIRVPSVTIAGYQVGPVWFSVLRGPDNAPPASALPFPRFGGTVGGNVLGQFRIVLDYPAARAEFFR